VIGDWTATLERLGARTTRGADDAALSRFRDELGLSLPEELKGLYRTSDGFRLEKGGLRILSLSEAMQFTASLRRFGVPRTWGYFPFADAEDAQRFAISLVTTDELAALASELDDDPDVRETLRERLPRPARTRKKRTRQLPDR
jgi:hypothetical protein